MLKLLKSLQTGDHIKVNGQDAMYSDHATQHGWWLRVWLDKRASMFILPNPPDADSAQLDFNGYKSEMLITLDLVARPRLNHTDCPARGDWFYIWYNSEYPSAYIFWHMAGPFNDGTYTIHEMSLWTVLRWQHKPAHLAKKYGWTNGVKRANGALLDRNRKIEFFTPPFMPTCLRLPASQLALPT